MKTKPSGPLTAIVASVACLTVAAGCGATEDSSASTLDRLRDDGVAKIGIAQLLPYASVDKEGEPEGYMIDVTAKVMEELGVEALKPTVTTFDAMIPGLEAKQFDMLPGGLNVTSERCETVIFSDPLTVQHDALYVPSGNEHSLRSVSDLAKDANLKLAVLTGSTQEAYALDQGVERGQLVTVADTQSGIDALSGGRADAFLLGQFSISDPADSGLEVVVDEATPLSGVGIAFRKSDADLRDEFDKVLESYREDGTLGDIYAEWGFTNREVLEDTDSASDLASGCS